VLERRIHSVPAPQVERRVRSYAGA
jgi:hypothetical protein